jgi:uncharacterized caspase-like protein
MKKRRSLSVVLAVAALGLFPYTFGTGHGLGKAEETATPQAAPPPSGTPKKLALLVGINNYKYSDRISPLAGSINDVEDMKQVLIGKFEFPPENILVLEDSQATHAAIINAIQTHLIANAQPGDIVVFHYSGHGSQMKDVTGKMVSGIDETIVPYDTRDPEGKVFDISGAELHALLLQLAAKTKNLTFILDSCHSGTLVRGARVRSIPEDTRTPPPLPSYASAATRGIGASNPETASPKFAFIAAATSKESAFEHFSDGKDHGALTYFLTLQLRSAKAGATYRDVMDSVVGNVTANYPAQHPSLEGAEADQYVFGDGSSLARVYVTASPSQLDPHRVTLNVGQVQGATVGSVYEVYPPGSKKFSPPDKPVATVQLASVDALASEATVVSGGKVAPASRAIERQHRYGNQRMRIFLDGLQSSPTLQSIRDALQPLKYIEVVDRPTLCNVQVREASGRIQTLGADSTTLSPPVAVSDPSVVDHVVGQIKLWAKWFNVLSIRNAQPGIDLQFTLKGSRTRDPMAHVGRPDMGVLVGENVDATLTNNSDRDLYIAILDLSSDGSVSVVYPAQQGEEAVLQRGLAITRSFITTLPKGRSRVTDILKVFASYRPIDLTPLTQAQIRGVPEAGGESDPLQELLMDSAGETRGLVPESSKSLDLGSWTTVQRVLVVKRAS